jgi:putative DNA primase/helicase
MELGQLTLIGGEAGSGKSLLACDLAARITAGRAWPDGAAAEPGSVLLVASAEDASGLWRPRLEAAGADIGRVHVLPVDPMTPPALPGDRGSPFRAMLKTHR